MHPPSMTTEVNRCGAQPDVVFARPVTRRVVNLHDCVPDGLKIGYEGELPLFVLADKPLNPTGCETFTGLSNRDKVGGGPILARFRHRLRRS
jgi:hypothetical protein